VRGLSFTVGGELYAVDVTLVQKVARKLAITPVPSAPKEVIGIANLKGRVVTVLSLDKLLGTYDSCDMTSYVNTIVFKSSSGNEDQMGLAVEKPGNLIDIENSAIRSPPATADNRESFCISGVTEIEDSFYRIIDVDYILRKFTHSGDTNSANTSYGGTENDQSI